MATHCLHVGINKFLHPENNLGGCVNDARTCERIFGRRRRGVCRDAIDMCKFFGRAESQVLLLDGQATRKRILAELDAWLKKLRRGDWGIFTFSSHGTYIRDRDGDEEDGHDEALVTADEDVILDDLFGERLQNREAGSRLIIQTDACHSGTGVRSLGPRLLGPDGPHRVRFLPPSRLSTRRRPAKMNRPPRLVDVIHFAACMDDEFAADTEFGGRPAGAYTHTWAHALYGLPAGATFGDWAAVVAKRLPNHTFDQCPQVNAYKRALDWKIPMLK